MKHTPNLYPMPERTIKDQTVAEAIHSPRAQALMAKLRSGPPRKGILREKLKAIIRGLQEPTCQSFVFHTKPAKVGLQIAEHIFTFLKTRSHQPTEMMRSMSDRSPSLYRPSAASFSLCWMRGGVSASSAIHLSSACLATSSLSRYPSAICRLIKASMGPVIVISMVPELRSPILSVNASASSR